jgi:hypothetical protein
MVARPKPPRTLRVRRRQEMNRAARVFVQYYAALRLSAAVATAFLPAERRDLPPIVRASEHELPGGFDRREVIFRGMIPLVITVPAATELRSTGITRLLSPN